MIRKIVFIIGVTAFTVCMLIAATIRVNGGSQFFVDFSSDDLNARVAKHAALAREAYLYSQPLLESYATLYDDIEGADKSERVGAFNTLKRVARVEGESEQVVGVKAWLDLRREPLVLHVPVNGKQRADIKLVDLYGVSSLNIGTADRALSEVEHGRARDHAEQEDDPDQRHRAVGHCTVAVGHQPSSRRKRR